MARALVRAAARVAREKAAHSRPDAAPLHTLIADGDRRGEITALHLSNVGENRLVEIRYFDHKPPRTLVRVLGDKARDAVLRLPDFRLVMPPKFKDLASGAVRRWATDYVNFYSQVTKKGSGWGVTWSADGTGQSVSIDIQNGTGQMSRLDLAASIDEYLPVVMAQAYSGSPEQVESQSRAWLAAHRIQA